MLLLGCTILHTSFTPQKNSPELSIISCSCQISAPHANTTHSETKRNAQSASSLQFHCNKSSNWQIEFDDQFDTISLSLLVYCGWVNTLIIMVLFAWYYSLFCFQFIVFVWENPKAHCGETSSLPLSTKCHRSWFAAEIVVVYHRSQSWLPASEWQACISSL